MQFIVLIPLMGLLLLMNFGACIQDLHVIHGSQSHEEILGSVHGDVYTAIEQLICWVRIPSMHVTLHQSGGGKPGADQRQWLAPTRVWSKPHQGPKKFAKEGGKSCDVKAMAIFF